MADKVGVGFFLAGEPDESVEAVEIEAFEVGAAPKKVVSLAAHRAFMIAFTMASFFVLVVGRKNGGSSCPAKIVSSAFVLRDSSLNSDDMLWVSAQVWSWQIKGVSKLKITFGFFGSPNFTFIALVTVVLIVAQLARTFNKEEEDVRTTTTAKTTNYHEATYSS